MVEKLQELRALRIQKLKKQGEIGYLGPVDFYLVVIFMASSI